MTCILDLKTRPISIRKSSTHGDDWEFISGFGIGRGDHIDIQTFNRNERRLWRRDEEGEHTVFIEWGWVKVVKYFKII